MEVISGMDEGDDLVHIVVASLAAGTGGEAIDLSRGYLDVDILANTVWLVAHSPSCELTQ